MASKKNTKSENEILLTEIKNQDNADSESLQVPLINKSEEDSQKGWKNYRGETCLEKMKRFVFGPSVQNVKRKIYISGKMLPENHQNNRIKNTKYTPLTFIPKVLYNQFKLFFNLFFLITALSQFIPPLQVGYIFTYIGPLALVLSMTMIKELYDDLQRYRRDNQANSEKYRKLTSNGFVTLKADEIRAGDIIEVNKSQRIPADLLLLYADDPNGTVFVKTDQLDGETDWKLRKAVKITQDFVSSKDPVNGHTIITFEDEQGTLQDNEEQVESQNSLDKTPKKAAKKSMNTYAQITDDQKAELLKLNCYVKAKEPIVNIYEFLGIFKARNSRGKAKKESLSLENTIWANIILASGNILGQVMYCGKETRMEMNSREPRSKIGRIDLQLSFLCKLLFALLIGLTGLIMALRPPTPMSILWLTSFMRYLILLSYLIPISLRTNLDFARLFYSIRINQDKSIPETIARNSNIPEELGRVQYLLSDKTGTLTQNDMIFKRLSLEQRVFTQEDVKEIQTILKDQFSKYKAPIPDSDKIKEATLQKKKFKRDNDVILRDLVLAIAVCHNVTPIYNEDGTKEFQASSPDEIALVTLAEELGLKLSDRTQDTMEIENCLGENEQFSILKIFPFSSDTKRMGILVRHLESRKIVFYLKGADSIMKFFLPERQRGYVDEQCEELAREGLRTLVITQKIIEEDWYRNWEKEYKQADEALDDRAEKVKNVISKLEKNMEFLGVTGVEDKLQENVNKSLEDIRQAGIKVWMLTGDKVETAICISISSGLKDPKHNIFLIKEIQDELVLQDKLNQFNNQFSSNRVLVIDGDSLKIALEHCESLFFEASCKAPSVVCCRCSPTQKAQITEKIKTITNKVTCCIGDGGNDVGMIQSSDVGIGIVGKEGKQAALAADYSITKFEYITKLILWHGRQSYKRTSLLSQFVLHRGMIIAIMQMIFICVFYFVSLQIFNSKLLLGFSTIFTMFPVFCLIFDKDVDEQTAANYPPLYKSLQSGRELNAKSFLAWFARAVYTGTSLMCFSLLFFKDSFLIIQSLLFSALIFIEYLMTLTELNKLHIASLISCVASMVLYIVVWFGFPEFFEISRLDSWQDFGKLIAVILISYGPILTIQYLRKWISPTDYETILKTSKQNKKRLLETDFVG